MDKRIHLRCGEFSLGLLVGNHLLDHVHHEAWRNEADAAQDEEDEADSCLLGLGQAKAGARAGVILHRIPRIGRWGS